MNSFKLYIRHSIITILYSLNEYASKLLEYVYSLLCITVHDSVKNSCDSYGFIFPFTKHCNKFYFYFQINEGSNRETYRTPERPFISHFDRKQKFVHVIFVILTVVDEF
jgi:hypothetical protein